MTSEKNVINRNQEQLDAFRFLFSDEFAKMPNKNNGRVILENLPLIEDRQFEQWVMTGESSTISCKDAFHGNFFNCEFKWCEFTNVQLLGKFVHCKFKNCTFNNCKFGRSTGIDTFEADFARTDFSECTFDDCAASHTSFFKAEFVLSKVHFRNLFIVNLYLTEIVKSDVRIEYASDVNFSRLDIGLGSKFDIEHHERCGLELVCPESGDFVAYKQVTSRYIDHDYWSSLDKLVVAKLIIPASAQRSSAFTRKCRASEAVVVGFYDLDGNRLSDEFIKNHKFLSNNDTKFIYKLGEKVFPDAFDTNRWNECSNGIHFFMTFNEAAKY